MTKRSLYLRDIILFALIGTVFSVVYSAANFVYNRLTALLTPIGYDLITSDPTTGIWCTARPLAGFLLRAPGAAFLDEFLKATVEMLLGNQWGAANLISGAVQGIGSEPDFTFVFYKMYNWLTLLVSSLTPTFVTFGWDWFHNGYNHFSGRILTIILITRLTSMSVFSGILARSITNLFQ